MTDDTQTLMGLERKFWQAIVDEDAQTAIDLLTEPALMVSSHGAMKFDHATYRRMAEQGTMTVKSFELSDMESVFPAEHTAVLTYRVRQVLVPRDGSEEIVQQMTDSSTWVRDGDRWQCVMHTETPVGDPPS